MPGSAHAALTMAGISAAGGVYAFAKAKSKASLVAGIGLGAAFAAGSYAINLGHDFEGHAIAAGTSLALVSTMGPRYIKTVSIMPAGILALLGTASFAYEAKKAYEWR